MNLVWSRNAWEDYLWWQRHDGNMLKRINALIKQSMRDPFNGLGDPEPLKHHLQGYWSRRINREHRLVYTVTKKEFWIVQCRFHY